MIIFGVCYVCIFIVTLYAVHCRHYHKECTESCVFSLCIYVYILYIPEDLLGGRALTDITTMIRTGKFFYDREKRRIYNTYTLYCT